MLWGLNEEHEIMSVPYYRAMYALSLIRGPNVNQWANDQVLVLRNRANDATNPVARTEETHWNEFKAAFLAAYTDIAKEQNAYNKLMHLRMYKNDLESYIATFKQLAKDANYGRDASATMHHFVKGLNPKIQEKLLDRDNVPTTIEEWETAARNEMKKSAFKDAILRPQMHHYQWKTPRHNGNGKYRRHPNDESVPMDVDPPVFTQVNRAYTEEDKRKHRAEGRCFRCSRIGHMARECPDRKTQPMQTKGRQKSSNPKHKKRFQKPQRFPVSQVRSAMIEEVDTDEEDEDEDDDDEEEDSIPSLAARTAKFTEKQREQWVKEMRNLGINFQ
jgi:hypothetical protein